MGLILIRHGRTAANAAGLLQGRTDNRLDDVGWAQARAAASLVGPVDRVIASSLTRARQSASAFEQPVEIDDRFIELDYGDWEGRPVVDVTDEQWATWRSDINFAPPGGESLAALRERVHAGLDELAEHASSHAVVIVTHVSPIKSGVTWALGVGEEATWNMRVGQGTITRISTSPKASLSSFNETPPL